MKAIWGSATQSLKRKSPIASSYLEISDRSKGQNDSKSRQNIHILYKRLARASLIIFSLALEPVHNSTPLHMKIGFGDWVIVFFTFPHTNFA